MHLGDDVPPIPGPAESALLSRRRNRKSRGLAATTSTTDPSSPEVITSLITSLSTISQPLKTHFENLPRIDTDSDPGLPEVPHTAPCLSNFPHSEHGFGMSYGAYKSTEETGNSPFLHPDDAALSPVIRMARAPPSPMSPKSPRSPRFRPHKMTAASSPARPASSHSFSSANLAPEGSAFGTISTEPGPRLSTAPSLASTSSAGRKSLRGQFGLLKKTSREFEKEPLPERARTVSSHNDSLRHHTPRSRASMRSLHSMADVAEESQPNGLMEKPHVEPVASTPPTEEHHSAQSPADNNPGGIGSGRIIPTRDSSLRHRPSQSSSGKRQRSTRHSRYSSSASQESVGENGLPGSSNDAEQVTRKIQEVKDQQQKLKTELDGASSPVRTTTKTAPAKPAKSSRTPSEIDDGRVPQNGFKAEHSPSFNESAPSPSVMTGKTRGGNRNGAPLASKPSNFSPQMTKPSFEKIDHEKPRYRPSLEPATPTKLHRRSPSGQVSAGRPSLTYERPSSADSIDYAIDEYIFSPKLTQRVVHPTTGRIIAFSEVGDPRGHVVLCCLGMGLTRYLMAFYDELARTLNLRLVTLDRPGVGESSPLRMDEPNTPLSWPDDVAIVCNYLRVTKFSILAHSAGAIYALATALRIPQHIRGRIHLLAPWIPPSQLSSIGTQKEPAPTNAVPYSQRILRALPASFLKVANTSFMSTTSASITSSLPKSPRRSKRKAFARETKTDGPLDVENDASQENEVVPPLSTTKPSAIHHTVSRKSDTTLGSRAKSPEQELERQRDYDTRLTHRIWELATSNANPAVDLMICLERRQTIGFRYVDITRSVVIQHGSKDTRVPVENVQWLGKTMRRCEVRILEGEGHGLMASAGVMGSVLTEIAKEWEDWTTIVQGKRRATAHQAARRTPSNMMLS